MTLFGLTASSPIPPATDRFISLSVGNTLVLKACGFIEDHHARILDVSETSLRVRTGHSWCERFFQGRADQKPLDISLLIQPLDVEREPHPERLTRTRNSYCTIAVDIRPASILWKQAEFNEAARRVIWSLRSYFMAC